MKEFLESAKRELKEFGRSVFHYSLGRFFTLLIIGGLILGIDAGIGYLEDKFPNNDLDNPLLPEPTPLIVLAAGDVNMGRQTGQKILAGDIDYPFAKLNGYLADADIAFVNLESQLADLGGETQSPTSEFRFAGPPDGTKSLKNAGIDIVSVANNHMWDYGKDRLFETLNYLDEQGVAYVGASREPANKTDPKIIEIRDRKVAFLAMTTLINGYERAGAAEYVSYNTQETLKNQIASLKDNVDWIFVSIHTGVEYQQKPTAAMVQMSREFIEAGADAVLGHHPHVIQPIEIYNDKPIFYSMGNFAFWQPFSFWTQHSYIARLKLETPHEVEYEIVPVNSGWQPEITTDPETVKTILDFVSPSLVATG